MKYKLADTRYNRRRQDLACETCQLRQRLNSTLGHLINEVLDLELNNTTS